MKTRIQSPEPMFCFVLKLCVVVSVLVLTVLVISELES